MDVSRVQAKHSVRPVMLNFISQHRMLVWPVGRSVITVHRMSVLHASPTTTSPTEVASIVGLPVPNAHQLAV